MENLELPGKHQEIKSSQILIFDPSFDENYGLEFAYGTLYGIIKNNIKRAKELHLFFGISERLNWHVMENAKTYSVTENRASNEGVVFHKGDTYRILERDGESVLVELIGNENNPYFVSADFLSSISEFE